MRRMKAQLLTSSRPNSQTLHLVKVIKRGKVRNTDEKEK